MFLDSASTSLCDISYCELIRATVTASEVKIDTAQTDLVIDYWMMVNGNHRLKIDEERFWFVDSATCLSKEASVTI